MEVNIKNVETVRLFGSYARGEQTTTSDYDILVILKQSQIINETLKNEVSILFDREVSISWYSKQRLQFLYDKGHLFAWHIYLESKKLTNHPDFITDLGTPNQYAYAYEDVWSLLEILRPIKSQIIAYPNNLIYEMGIAYVCARNISICALPKLKKQYSFSVNAPFELNLPMSVTDFEIFKNCRYSSIRGTQPPDVDLNHSLELCEIIVKWGEELLMKLK